MKSPDILSYVTTGATILSMLAIGRDVQAHAQAQEDKATPTPTPALMNYQAEGNIEICLDGAYQGTQPDGKCDTEGDIPLPGVPVSFELIRQGGSIKIDRTVPTDQNGKVDEKFTGQFDPKKENITLNPSVPGKLIIPIGNRTILACVTGSSQNPEVQVVGNTKYSKMNGEVIYGFTQSGECPPSNQSALKPSISFQENRNMFRGTAVSKPVRS
ncbi:MAG TPA: hypothetical protein ACFYEK_15750 [Candidatus Wunengus sp. YC60]|uniref:hypothetical protein n=1 Tax=Candidatus Wunengus sp. YC60 TaxID=3367697 RepID=UPI004026BC24